MFKVSCSELKFLIDAVETFSAPKREIAHHFLKDSPQEGTGKFKINHRQLIIVVSGQTAEQ